MSGRGVYVYGLVRAAEAPALGAIGIERDGRPAPVRSIAAEGVAALVSTADSARTIPPLSRHLTAHSRVIQETLRTATIVPMAFGHVARSEREIARRLRRQAPAIAAELDRLEGKVEVGLRVQWDVRNIFQYLVERDAALRERRDQVFGGPIPPGAAEKMELGRLFEERLKSERLTVTERLLDELAWDAVELEIGEVHGEKTAADLAFLVEREYAPAFKQKIVAMAAAWPSEYVFHPSGPWAPFHFVQLQIADGEADEESGGFSCAS